MNKRPFLRLPMSLNKGAIQIALLYLLIGGLWILLSDKAAARIAPDQETLTIISLYKGWGYVFVTALLLYWLIQRDTAAVRASESQLQQVIDALPALIAYVDKDRRYRFTNMAYKEWFGDTARGKTIEEVFGKSTYQTISKYVDEALLGKTVSYESIVSYPLGERFVTATYTPDKTADGRVKGFFALVQDVTENKQTREELRQWADAFNGCAHGIAIGDPSTNRVVVCNPAFASMHKCRVEDIVGSAILSLYAPTDHEHVRHNIAKADQIGRVRYEADMIRRDGSTFPVQMDVVSVLGDEGELLYRVDTAQDISERKQVEEESKSIARFPGENHNPVLRATYEGKIIYANAASNPLLDDWHSSVGSYLPAEWIKLISELIDTGTRKTIDIQCKDTTYSIVLAPIPDANYLNLYGTDITERKQAEEKLRKSEERYRYLFENNPYPMWIYDRETLAFLDVNEAAVAKYGYSRQEFLNMTIVDIRPPEDVDRLLGNLAQPREPLEYSTGWRHRLKDGRIIDVEITSHTIEIDGHESVLVIAQDITERKQAEEALRNSQAQMAGIFNSAMDAILSTDADQRIVIFNPAAEAMFQCDRSQAIGQPLERFIPERFREAHRKYIHNFGQTGFTSRAMKGAAVVFGRRSSGDEFPCEASISQVEIAGKKIYTVILRDITERKQIEKALQEAHDELELKVQERTAALSEANTLLQALMDNMPDHIYFKDTQSRFIRNSRSQATLLGLSDPAQVVGKTDFDFFPHAARAYAEEQEVMRSGKPLVDLEEWVVWPGGQETWVSTTKVPLRNSEGKTIGIFGISRDITERKRAEQAIRQLNTDLEKQTEQLESANKELEAFSYSVSHDLRAPLRAIDGYTRILVEDYEAHLDAEGKRICSVISGEARRLGQLIDDLLAFSRLGRKEMYTSKVDMKALAISVFDELIKGENEERIDFQIAKLPAVKADPSLMRQVWTNLLANAIKFTSRKERAVIKLGTRQSKDEYIYYVSDTGAGFDMEYVDKLFGVFQRLHSESEFEGTGVGLAIVQRIIRRHGGRVWAEGESEKGATFYFALPRKEASA